MGLISIQTFIKGVIQDWKNMGFLLETVQQLSTFTSIELSCTTRHNPWKCVALFVEENSHVFLILYNPFASFSVSSHQTVRLNDRSH